ncbi:ash family protein [Pseudomonas fluorescens]|nr:ash family protein [Pseudomonas fluorescens]MBD8228972.1 ash family protein [Pseudomonas fluorescens]MBD8787029.1 ash family protein [Pseudomonas fluorescens]MBD8819137.1 ash family protein [Pseudomonas fluorescens]
MPNQCISPPANLQAPLVVARRKTERYALAVAANSAAGRGNPFENLAHRRPHYDCRRLFFGLQFRVMAAVCGQASAWPGSKFPGISTPCTAATQSRGKDRGSSIVKLGAPHMHALNPSKIRAAAHRAMARAALHANSSLRSRLARYNSHMEKARALEATGGVK